MCFQYSLFVLMAEKDQEILEQLDNLGKRLLQLRKEKGYTNYEQFAFDHNIPRAQYGRYEKGQDLRFSSLYKITKALGVTMEEFFSEGFE